MTDSAGGKIERAQTQRYRSTRGLNYGSVPWKLWEKSKKLFWDPADLDFSQDAVDWQEVPETFRMFVALSARGFMIGEEAVTFDIVPLLRCMSELGRLEDTMYLSMFAMEEAKHTEMFRRWFDAVDLDPSSLDDVVRARRDAIRRDGNGGNQVGELFDGVLATVMRRLDTDRSPEAILDATLVYNHLVEGVAAVAGYKRWNEALRRLGKLPGLEAGLRLTQRDERRHIAYGTYLARQILSENPELWEFVERRWAELTVGIAESYGGPAQQEQTIALGFGPAEVQALIDRRLASLRVAVTMRPVDVEQADVESFVPEELASIT
jgi:ribonucleoside-diphosphate reductase beta chain